MLLTLTVDGPGADDLGYLLHKHPARVQTFEQSVGAAHVLYPRADAERCTVALLLEVDPVDLVRGRGRGSRPDAGGLGEYVNDRPYAASSMLAVALGKVFRSAMAGRCEARPELVDRVWTTEVHVPAVTCRGGADAAVRLLAPLGWEVHAAPVPLDPAIPAWGDSRYVDLRLTGTHRVADTLSHLYVLLPALDSTKHYWVGADEVEKLLRAGERWLPGHPAREEIARRYLAHRPRLTATALDRLAEVDELPSDGPDEPDAVVSTVAPDHAPSGPSVVEALVETAAAGAADPSVPVGTAGPESADTAEPVEAPTTPLAVLRRQAVLARLREVGARSVVDVGCGEGHLLGLLLQEGFERVLGVDVSPRALDTAARRLRLDTMPERVRERLTLAQSSVTYTDARLAGFDAAVLMEVVEHVDPPRLPALERAVLGAAAPATVVVTTPNAEHNVRYPALAGGGMRHPDHRFEWTREEFAAWARAAAGRYGYDVTFHAVGEDDPDVGPPTQMAVLRRAGAA